MLENYLCQWELVGGISVLLSWRPGLTQSFTKGTLHKLRLSKMVQNGPKWSKMVQNGPKWSKMVQNGPKWSKMVQNGPKWSKMVQNSQWSAKKGTKCLPLSTFFWWIVLRGVIWHLFFGDWGWSEKHFEIKPPLAHSELDERRPLPHWRCC